MPIKLLDCTLRDGGYKNNWIFSLNNQIRIIQCLIDSSIDFIEIGWLREKEKENNTFFSKKEKLHKLKKHLKNDFSHFLLMLDINDYSEKLINEFVGSIFGIRLVFYKTDIIRVNSLLIELVSLGFKVFLQPMNLFSYDRCMLNELIRISNLTGVSSLGIVDSFGYASSNDIRDLILRLDQGLNRDIDIDIHLHNNLGIVNSNVYFTMTHEINRNLIIDSTICGIGRGAGNMTTESLVVLSNNICEDGKYNLKPLLKYVYNYFNEVFVSNDKKYYVAYFLSALNKVHPNYVDYVLDERLISYDKLYEFIFSIPENIKESCSKESAIKLFDNLMVLNQFEKSQ